MDFGPCQHLQRRIPPDVPACFGSGRILRGFNALQKTPGGSEQHPLRGAKDSAACTDARRRHGLAGAQATITRGGGTPGW